jgi:hypothetical protein
MQTTDKEIRADAKLKNLPAQALEDLWRFRNPEEDGEKLTLEAVAVQVQDLFGFTCSLSSLSEFYKWLRLKKRMESAAERATQARFALAADPGMTPDMLARVGQMVFTAETIEDGNVKAYVELVKLQLQAAKQDLELRKLKILESKAAALDALQAKAKEIKAGGGLSAETLEVIEKQLKLL